MNSGSLAIDLSAHVGKQFLISRYFKERLLE